MNQENKDSGIDSVQKTDGAQTGMNKKASEQVTETKSEMTPEQNGNAASAVSQDETSAVSQDETKKPAAPEIGSADSRADKNASDSQTQHKATVPAESEAAEATRADSSQPPASASQSGFDAGKESVNDQQKSAPEAEKGESEEQVNARDKQEAASDKASGQKQAAREEPTKAKAEEQKAAPGEQKVSPEAQEVSPEAQKGAPEAEKVAFSSLNLHPDLAKAISSMNFDYCTPIQGQTLPQTLLAEDLIGQAQTGTGKTAAFLITILQRIALNPIPEQQQYASEPRALVVAPTRELALQIEKDARQLARYMNLNIISVIGGTQLDRQRKQLRNERIDILIATPGRLLDHLSSRDIYLDMVEILVLDEADRMLDMGFIPDVKRIVRATPRTRQTLLFSATFSEDILNLARRWTLEPKEILLVSDIKPADTVDQIVYMVEAEKKQALLINLLKKQNIERVIVFCNRRDETRRLCDNLNKKGVTSELISGELPQQKRLRTLEKFREGKFRVLVATDVAGRGIHIDGVSHVVNYNLPDDPEDYVHRIGRTGRAGAQGISISFACEDDSFLIPDLEGYLGKPLKLIHPEDDLVSA